MLDSVSGFEIYLPAILVVVFFASVVYWLSPKIGARRWLWVALMLIPVLNGVFMLVFLLMIVGSILDKLNAVVANLDKIAGGPDQSRHFPDSLQIHSYGTQIAPQLE